MKKLRVFLDTSIIISYSKNGRDVRNIFSKDVLDKVQYIINPIVYQEILLAGDRNKKMDFKELDKYVNLSEINLNLKTNKKMLHDFRNYIVHSNDLFILQSAISNSDYLLTLDKELLNIGEIESLKVISPEEFFKILEARQ